jgi:hypothetical protein
MTAATIHALIALVSVAVAIAAVGSVLAWRAADERQRERDARALSALLMSTTTTTVEPWRYERGAESVSIAPPTRPSESPATRVPHATHRPTVRREGNG